MIRVSTSTTRSHRNWQAGEVFTVTDATELYEVDAVGQGILLDLPGRPRPRPPDEGPGASRST